MYLYSTIKTVLHVYCTILYCIVLFTVEPLYSGHHWDKYKCPEYRGVLISGVNLHYKAQFGTFVSVLNTGVSSFQGVLNRGVSLYIHVHVND